MALNSFPSLENIDAKYGTSLRHFLCAYTFGNPEFRRRHAGHVSLSEENNPESHAMSLLETADFTVTNVEIEGPEEAPTRVKAKVGTMEIVIEGDAIQDALHFEAMK